jgi:type III secretion protein C
MTKRTEKIKHLITCSALIVFSFTSHPDSLVLEEEEQVEIVEASQSIEEGYSINFNDVPVIEFIRFVSKISQENFIFDQQEMRFNVSLSTGKAVAPDKVLQALVQLLKVHGFAVNRESDYYVIHKATEEELARPDFYQAKPPLEGLIAAVEPLLPAPPPTLPKEDYEFLSYKIQYHEGAELEESLKKIAADLRNQPDAPIKLINAIQSLQWVKATNSLLCSADGQTLNKLRELIDTVDVPLRQVFIEVLVIETDVKKNMEFGLQWAAGGQYQDKLGLGMGNFQPHLGGPGSFASTMQGINATNTPTGLGQIPLAPGFDLGVIGDIIMHKGRSYFSLGSLVSALQMDGDSTIVLNQKIITQDNKNSTIFVGDNIPFTGSVVQTVGQSQQTTANIEYRDIGVSLSITPRLGEGDVITLDLNEEITESLDHEHPASNSSVNGIRTTKTNMATHVHVPDKNFLVLSGMIRNTKAHHKAGIPCLGGLPYIGAAFSKTRHHDEKRNVVIFVRPHIIRSFEDYQNVSKSQQDVFKTQANPKDFTEAIDILPQN